MSKSLPDQSSVTDQVRAAASWCSETGRYAAADWITRALAARPAETPIGYPDYPPAVTPQPKTEDEPCAFTPGCVVFGGCDGNGCVVPAPCGFTVMADGAPRFCGYSRYDEMGIHPRDGYHGGCNTLSCHKWIPRPAPTVTHTTTPTETLAETWCRLTGESPAVTPPPDAELLAVVADYIKMWCEDDVAEKHARDIVRMVVSARAVSPLQAPTDTLIAELAEGVAEAANLIHATSGHQRYPMFRAGQFTSTVREHLTDALRTTAAPSDPQPEDEDAFVEWWQDSNRDLAMKATRDRYLLEYARAGWDAGREYERKNSRGRG